MCPENRGKATLKVRCLTWLTIDGWRLLIHGKQNVSLMSSETFKWAVLFLLAGIFLLLWLVTVKLDEIRNAAQRVGKIMENQIDKQNGL